MNKSDVPYELSTFNRISTVNTVKTLYANIYPYSNPNIIPQLDGSFSPPLSPSLSSSFELYPCGILLPKDPLENPVSSCQVLQSDLSPISQLDGNQSPPIPSSQSSQTSLGQLGAPARNLQLKQAPYALNRQKQIKRLYKDTFLEDVTITVSPQEQNVNIQCSTGFYTQIAVPAFSDIVIGSNFEVAGIKVFCYDITGKIDDTEAAVNTVIFFRFSQHNQSKGGVAMHLHQTKRKIQVQGSSIMPDKSKAPVWFAQHVINGRFQLLAKSKSYDIVKFNEAVRELVTKHLGRVKDQVSCKGCNLPFSGRSTPEHCNQCKQVYHKTKCFPSNDHTCYRSARAARISSNQLPAYLPQSTALPSLLPQTATMSARAPSSLCGSVQPVSPPSTAQPTLTLSPSTTCRTSSAPPITAEVSAPRVQDVFQHSANQLPGLEQLPGPGQMPDHLPPGPSHMPDHHLPGPSHLHAHQMSGPTQLPGHQMPVPSHLQAHKMPGPSQLPSHQLPGPSQLPGHQPHATQPPKNKGKNKAKEAPASDKLSVELEFARIEVKIAKTAIKEQETTIKDLKFRNEILEARIKILEQEKKQEIYDRYFPYPPDGQTPTAPAPSTQPTETLPNCCHVQTCCRGQSHTLPPCPTRPSTDPKVTGKDYEAVAKLDRLTTAVESLHKEVEDLRCKFDKLSSQLKPIPGSASPIKISKNHQTAAQDIYLTAQASPADSSSLSIDQHMSENPDDQHLNY